MLRKIAVVGDTLSSSALAAGRWSARIHRMHALPAASAETNGAAGVTAGSVRLAGTDLNQNVRGHNSAPLPQSRSVDGKLHAT